MALVSFQKEYLDIASYYAVSEKVPKFPKANIAVFKAVGFFKPYHGNGNRCTHLLSFHSFEQVYTELYAASRDGRLLS
jgi:hypothetical protein